MPVIKCPNGKYRIGSGPCVFTSKEKAERAYASYRAKKHDNKEVAEMNENLEKGLFEVLGGRGSGNLGHAGRPGKRGGSATGKGGKGKEQYSARPGKVSKEAMDHKEELKLAADLAGVDAGKLVKSFDAVKKSIESGSMKPVKGVSAREESAIILGKNIKSNPKGARDMLEDYGFSIDKMMRAYPNPTSADVKKIIKARKKYAYNPMREG